MKKIALILAMALLLILAILNESNAQTIAPITAGAPATEDYFTGKWKSMIKGIPQGDTEVTIVFEKINGKLGGSLISIKDNTTAKFDSITVKDGVLHTNFMAQGYAVDLSLSKKDDDNISGSMMGQFEVTGSRIK